jgi:hypothetical protein
MNKNVKVLLSAVALAILVAAPAVAKSRTQPHHTASTQAHRRSTDIRDIQTGEISARTPIQGSAMSCGATVVLPGRSLPTKSPFLFR